MAVAGSLGGVYRVVVLLYCLVRGLIALVGGVVDGWTVIESIVGGVGGVVFYFEWTGIYILPAPQIPWLSTPQHPLPQHPAAPSNAQKPIPRIS